MHQNQKLTMTQIRTENVRKKQDTIGQKKSQGHVIQRPVLRFLKSSKPDNYLLDDILSDPRYQLLLERKPEPQAS
jgi:hypothetical protein